MDKLTINYIQIKELKPYKNNARTHSKKQIKQLINSIQEFGFTNPILIDENKTILAGHGRLMAAQDLAYDKVPCVRLDQMSDAQKRAYILADNKLALNAGWDEELLAEELGFLLEKDISFDTDLTGFSIAEVDMIIEGKTPEEKNDPKDDIAVSDEGLIEVQEGDLWALGNHRLLCGNCLDKENLSALMSNEHATMIFTDPPYNVPIDGFVGGKGKIKHREFAMATGEMSKDDFTSFLKDVFSNCSEHSKEGSIHYICMDWRHMQEVLDAGEDVYTELKNLIVWVKDNGGMGTFYRSRHELIFAFKKGTVEHINSFELGQHGRYRTNVWEYKGVNSLGGNRQELLELHPTVKPVQLIIDAIKDVSKRNDIVLDLFGGSGSTLIAAHKTGRRAFMMELDPVYCARIIKRYEIYANDKAIKLKAGATSLSETTAAE